MPLRPSSTRPSCSRKASRALDSTILDDPRRCRRHPGHRHPDHLGGPSSNARCSRARFRRTPPRLHRDRKADHRPVEHERPGEIPRSLPAIGCVVRWPSVRLPGALRRETAGFAIEASRETTLGYTSASRLSISGDCSRSDSASRAAGKSLRRSRSSGLTRRERHL